MKNFTIKSLILAFAMILSACSGGAPAAEPTVSAADIQSTAVAAAFTIIAETQAAIPTNTPVPPTNTPLPTALPTETPVLLPTLDAPTLAPTLGSAPQATNDTAGDPCNQALPASIDGHPTKIRVNNKTKGTLVGSLYLNKTVFGECGWRGVNLGKNDSVTFTDLVQGCYNISVFVNGNEGKDSKAFGYGCITGTDMTDFDVYAESVTIHGP
jgi:hypothetical protein